MYTIVSALGGKTDASASGVAGVRGVPASILSIAVYLSLSISLLSISISDDEESESRDDKGNSSGEVTLRAADSETYRCFVSRRGRFILKKDAVAIFVGMRSLVRFARRCVKIVETTFSPDEITFDLQQAQILVEGCAFYSGVLFGSRRGQRKLILVVIGREV